MALQGAGQGIGYYAGNMSNGTSNMIAAPVGPPPTLVSAIGNFESLEVRLGELIQRAHAIASAVGGPFPIGSDAAKDTPSSDTAVQKLNDSSRRCHRQVDDLSECLGALGRSLGI